MSIVSRGPLWRRQIIYTSFHQFKPYKIFGRQYKQFKPLKYRIVRIYESDRKSEINAENLYTAIRCYFEVPKRYTVKDCILTRMYLTEIIRKRRFYEDNYKRSGFDIFKSYMKGVVNNMRNVSKEHDTNLKDVQIIVNDFLNLLINDILADLKAGKLKVNDFQP